MRATVSEQKWGHADISAARSLKNGDVPIFPRGAGVWIVIAEKSACPHFSGAEPSSEKSACPHFFFELYSSAATSHSAPTHWPSMRVVVMKSPIDIFMIAV